MREFRSALPSLLHKRGIDIIPVTLEVVFTIIIATNIYQVNWFRYIKCSYIVLLLQVFFIEDIP